MEQAPPPGWKRLLARYRALSRSRQVILLVFLVWAAQAIPKWTAAILADGERAAAITTFFITPREQDREAPGASTLASEPPFPHCTREAGPAPLPAARPAC